MRAGLQDALVKLLDSTVVVSAGDGFPQPGQAFVSLLFVDGTILDAEYWRLIENGAASYSSFDHQQKYGLPKTIDAVEELRNRLSGKTLTAARHDLETGDLVFEFNGDTKLQILNVTGYEIWQLRFPSGAVEYSNYAK
jgi:hypothetical protein